jgi:putative membrane protein
MNTFTALTSVLASQGEHDGYWFPFALLWLALLGTIVWLFVRDRRRRPATGLERARDILAERYARGEIDGEEYRRRLDDIR